jgi:hypothetical protein
MKIFHCDHCDNLVFFENDVCVSCQRRLGYVPDLGCMVSLDPEKPEPWQTPNGEHREFRLCENYRIHNVCNWLVPAEDEDPLCASCRLTRVIPNLDVPANIAAGSSSRSRSADWSTA